MFFALLLALLFIVPPVDMLQFDSSDDGIETRDQDGSVMTNEQDPDDLSEGESGSDEQLYAPDDVNVEGDKSSKKFLDAFKLNFDPWNPEDGDLVECTATVHNFGEEWQVAEDVNVDFWFNDNFIGTAYIEEILPGDNGTASVDWKAVYGSHNMRVVADPDASGGGPDDYEVQLNVSRSDYSIGLSCAENASWIKNSQTNYYYILVENRGDKFDTYDLTLETTKYGEDTSGWQNIQLDEDVVALDTGESDYVELSIKYLAGTPDYKTQAVVKVMAQSRGDTERSAEVFTTTDMIHDVPILFVDDDGQHDVNGDGDPMLPGTFWLNEGTYGAHSDYLMTAALDKNYEGMYDTVTLTGDVKSGGWINNNNMGDSGPVFNSQTTGYNAATYPYEDGDGDDIFLENYDAVIWIMGYCECLNSNPSSGDAPHSNNDDWYDQEEVAKYLDHGGMFWFNGNSINQYHDQYAPVYGECQNEFIKEYFRVQNWAHAGMKPQIVGVSQDPIGQGINVQNGYFYGNYVDSVERGNVAPDIEPMDDAHGVFYGNGKHYSAIRYEHPRESANSQRYRTYLSGGFENFGDFENVDEHQRVQLIENVLTWFGVPPANAPEYDLGVASINQPLGDIIDPAHAVPISVTIQNYGQKEITSSFDVRFRVDEVGGSNKFSKTISVADDLAPGETIEVATSWNSNLPVDGKDYTFTVSLPSPPGGTGENADNNELETEKSAADTIDIEIGRITQDWETPWNAFMVGFDAVFHSKIINNGSSEQTFDVHLTIYSPLETIVFERTQSVTLLPGYSETLDWLWVPRNPGGIMTGFGGGPDDLQEAYVFQLYAEVEDDDNLANNEAEVDVAVMAFWDGGEPAFMKQDWVQVDLSGHDNHGKDDEITPWHLQDSWFMSPNHAWFIANDDRELKAGWDTAIVTPYQISFEGVTRASCISTGSGNAGGASARYEISADYDGNPDNIEEATWNQIRSATYGNEGVWVVGGATSISDSYFDQDYYLRLHFGTTSSDARLGHYEEDFAIFANVDQYNSNDLGVKKMSISPLIDQAEMPREIEVTVENYGENKTNSGGRPNFKVEVSITDEDLIEVYNEKIIVDNIIGIGETVTLKFDDSTGREWYPEENGIYQISARTIWEDDGENIDENPHNDVLNIDGIVQKDFFTDDMETGINDWETAGGANGWALGMPTNEPVPHSGDNCWGTNLDGNYPDLNDNSLTLEHYVDLRTASDPVLSFWHWLEVEAHDYDTAFVEIRTSEESTYTQIWENPSPARQGVPYETEEWQVVTLEIDEFAYHEVFIRFRLQTDGDTNYLGWYIDDVAVGGTIPPQHDVRIVTIDYPADDTHIPPGETIEIKATVMNVGQNQEVIPVVCKAYRQGGSPKTFDVGDEDTELLNPGDKEQVTFTWNLPLGTAEYELHIYTDLGTDTNDGNDLLTKYVWAQEIFDISIDTVYADPMVQDVARTREITAEVRNIGNTQLDGNIEVTFEAYLVDYDDDPVDSYTAVLTLGRGESSPVPWNWQSFKYGEYYVVVEGDIVGKTEKPEHLLDNTYTLEDIITVETIFSDTREMDDSPYYLERTVGEFKIWDHTTQGFFWSQDDNMSQDNMPGWHVDDEGHFSRYSWYGGVPSQGRYANNMESYLTSQALDLTGYNDVHLSFYTKYVLEGRLYDYVDVSITNDIGDENSWERLDKYPGDDDSYDSSRQAGNTYGWLHKDILIPEVYLTGEVYLRILLKTDNGITYRGVWIDDITLFGQTSGNHAPVARFDATYTESSYSRNVILNPPMDLIHIKGNFAFNNMPQPNGSKQGGIPVGAEVTFDASLTFDPDAEDDYISYSWDFGDDETESGKVITHEFDGEVPLEGYFIVTLTVRDGDGKESIDTIFVHVGNTAPVPDYHVTPYYNVHYYIDEHNDPIPEDDIIDVFYGDRITFIQNASDAEGDSLDYEWFFECVKTGHIDTDEGDTVEGIVGIDFLIEDLDDGVPIIPTPNTNAVDYDVSIHVSDPATTTIMTKTVRVHPYARETFEKSVRLGSTLVSAEVTVTWRGFLTEAAEAGLVSPEHPVYVYIDETAISPDPLLASRGGIGHVYDITCVGTYMQNGDEGFIHAEIKLPMLTSDLDGIGDAQALEKDLKLEYYDENQKRFFPVDDSQVLKDKGVSYVIGSTDHFSLFTAIVDTVYIGQLSADLTVEEMVFSRAPVIDRSETEIRVRIRNIGPINAKDVKVRFFDGSELIDERTIPEIPANDPDGVWVKVSYNVSMVNTAGLSEKHTVVVNVNPLHAVKEEQYNNNIETEQLDVVRQATSTNSFGMSFIMLAISAMAVVALAEVYKRKR